MIESLADSSLIMLLAELVLVLVLIGIGLNVGYVIPRAMKGVRVTSGLRNGRKVYAWYQLVAAGIGLTKYILFGVVAAALLLVDDYETRTAITRFSLIGVLVLMVVRDLATPYAGRRMDTKRLKLDQAAAEEIEALSKRADVMSKTAKDTNETVHRIDHKLDQSVIDDEGRDVKAQSHDEMTGDTNSTVHRLEEDSEREEKATDK